MTTPTSKALEKAVERAAKAAYGRKQHLHATGGGGYGKLNLPDWDDLPPEARAAISADESVKIRRVLSDALPQLFNNTAWIAPWEATEEMRSACRELTDPIYSLLPGEHLDYDPEDCVFPAMRDAYLNAERKE